MFKFSWNAFLLAIYRAGCSLDASSGTANPNHGLRVAIMCLAVGRALGFPRERMVSMVSCALLHDIVNPPEYKIVGETIPNVQHLQEHCTLGQEMLDYLPFPSPINNFIAYHHEFIDGSGPFGKRGEEIPFEASLICLCGSLEVTIDFDTLGTVGLALLSEALQTGAFDGFNTQAVRALAQVLDGRLLHLLRSDILYLFWEMLHPYEAICTGPQMYRLGSFMADLVGAQSDYTRVHSAQMANIAWQMGYQRGYDEQTLAMLFVAGCIHDAGKLSISGRLLDRQGKLSKPEMEVVQTHAMITRIVADSIGGFEDISAWAGNHHERLDGSGYPNGYNVHQLDEPSQLLAVCDVYEAVGASRPYHPQRTAREIFGTMHAMADQGKLNTQMATQACELLKTYPVGEVPAPWELAAA
jgi:HD-GYP domain-containing protein (c-di-GMP phosphodiesterase class II)